MARDMVSVMAQLGLWSELATNMTGAPVGGGHFFPEERPSAIASALSGFFTR